MASEVIAPYAGKYYVLAYVDDGSQRYGLTKTSAKKWELKRAMPSRDPASGRPTVQFQLDPRGGVQFAEVTRRNIGRQLAIFLDGVATSHARIQSQISEHGVITGNFTQERVMEIVRKLEAGSLPARLKEVPLQEKYIGPALGAMNRDRALKAAMYGFIAVAAYMILYYMYLGVLADIALTLNVLFVLAIMAAMEATFTLPGVAGVALTIGMAVDANVLINERIREELRRGVGLKKAIKLGYDKALAAIVDSNLTTLLSCVILGYVGSEEIKGFAMTLGFGVIISMFTALFVTHLILDTLVDRNLVKKLPMLGLIPPTKIDWFALRKPFWTVSLIVLVLGVGFFTVQAARTPAAVFDIELMGGSSVQVELADGVDMDRDAVLAAVTGKGKGGDEKSAADWLRDAADRLAAAKVEPVPGASGEYLVTAEGLSPADVNTMLLTTFERSLARGGFSAEGESARVRTQRLEADEEGDGEAAASGASVDLEGFKAGLASAAEYVRAAADRVADARVLAVAETSEALAGTRTFEIVTVESNKEILRLAILGAMGDRLKVERRIDAVLVTDAERAPDGLFPVREEDRFLGDVLGIEAPIDIQTFKGGVVFVFDQLDPPQTLADLERRFREMRLQPQFEEHAAREEKIFGLTEAGQTRDGAPLFNKIAVVVGDEELMFSDDPAAWEDSLAKPELVRAQEALAMEKSMSKVVQFAPQMARGTQQQAFIAIVLAMIGIILYLWFRFGTMQYGLAAIVALVFDVGVVLGVMAIGELLEIGNLKMDLTMIAAILTVVGYSVNDKIVVFDRVRENLGKLKQITVPVINNSINGTLSRTVLTGGTVLMTMILMYIFGGAGVRGFCLVMIVGVTIGTFSSIGIAAPLLYSRRLTHDVVYCLAGAVAILMTYAMADSAGPVIGVAVVVAIIVGLLLTIERRTEAGQPAAPVAV
jgi:protein-export membrane protein SecD/preprotein translocase SecF subunit